MHRCTPVIVLVFLCMAGVSHAAGPARSALTFDNSVVYVRRGFDPSSVVVPPSPATGEWLAVSMSERRSLAVRDLPLPGNSRPGPWELSPRKPEMFTYAFVFNADLSLINTTGLSILVPRAGQGWRLYLNGLLVRDELKLREDGEFAAMRCLRDSLIPLDKRFLRVGPNVVAFQLYGDPADEWTGLPGRRPIVIDAYARIVRTDLEYIDIMLIGVYALFGLYHFGLFAMRPKERSYLVYGVATLIISVFLFSRTRVAADVVHDTRVLRNIDSVSMFLILPSLLFFFEEALRRRVSLVAKLSLALAFALAPLVMFFRPEVAHNVWEAASAAGVVYVFAAVIAPSALKEARMAPPGARLGAGLASSAGMLGMGSLVLALAVAVDIAAVNSGGEMRYARYAFLFLVLGAASVLAARYARVHAEGEALARSLERKVAERSRELEVALRRGRELGGEIEHRGRELAEAMEVARRELELAERVQRGLFSGEPPHVDGWDIAVAYRPASSVSGDFYDFYAEDGKLEGLVVGDVSGHGVGAGLVAVLARSVFARHFAASGNKPLGEVVGAVHEELGRELGGVDEYLTCAILRIQDGRVEYANAAHPDIFYRKGGSGSVRALVPRKGDDFRGPPLGREGLDGTWQALRFAPEEGDAFLVFTDCLEEAQNSAGERFGRERLAASIARAPMKSARQLLDAVLGDLVAFMGDAAFRDDLTVVVVLRSL